MIKYMFTGDLNADIDSCPPFPGKERHMLRAQLARISHATELCLKGQFEIDEETNEVKTAEEAPAFGTEDLKNLENWSHKKPHIYEKENAASAGLTTLIQVGEDEVEGKVDLFRELALDEPMDKKEENAQPAWLSKVCGDAQ